MRSYCVFSVRERLVSYFLSFAFSALLAVFYIASSSNVEAARRSHSAGGGYSPPFASIVYDVNSKRVLESNNPDAPRHPASITKVMTLYMLFEQLDAGKLNLESRISISKKAASQAPSKLGIEPGESISVEDAIRALVTKSANDIAVAVAESIGGSEERFAQMMTRKARSIGMKNSSFYNASGLPNPSQITTARDLATLGIAIQDKFPEYYTYFGTRVFNYEGQGYRNHNRLLGQIEGVDGIKTGYTRASGFNLLTSAKSNGRHIITVVLGGRTARERDEKVASLVEEYVDKAQTGRAIAKNTPEIKNEKSESKEISAREEDNKKSELASASFPRPPVRIASVSIASDDRLSSPPSELNRVRQMALAATGSTNVNSSNVVRSATTPLALVNVTHTPVRNSDDMRLYPPVNVQFTNSIPSAVEKKADDTTAISQPIPDLSSLQALEKPSMFQDKLQKNEERLSLSANKVEPTTSSKLLITKDVAMISSNVDKNAGDEKEKPVVNQHNEGWFIQLAASSSDDMAKKMLDDAISKGGIHLKKAEPFTEAVHKDGYILYRARFKGFKEEKEAQVACQALQSSGFNCFAQKL